MALSSTTIPVRSKCKLCALIETLPDEDANALRSWLADPNCSNSAIADAISQDEDTPGTIGNDSVRRHRTQKHKA